MKSIKDSGITQNTASEKKSSHLCWRWWLKLEEQEYATQRRQSIYSN